MFVKNNVFKKMLKEAYTGTGLHVSHTTNNEGNPVYVFSGRGWVLWVGKNWITKEMKAAAIEICGDLPNLGEAYKFEKDHEPQYEFDDSYTGLLKDCYGSDRELYYTDILNSHKGYLRRVLKDDDGKIYLVDNFFHSVISKKEIDHEHGETELRGPFTNEQGKILYWDNNAGVLAVGASAIPEEEREFWKAAGELL